MGYKGRRQSRKATVGEPQARRKSRRQHPPGRWRPERPVRGRTRKVLAEASPRDQDRFRGRAPGRLLQGLPVRCRARLGVLQLCPGCRRAQRCRSGPLHQQPKESRPAREQAVYDLHGGCAVECGRSLNLQVFGRYVVFGCADGMFLPTLLLS